MQHSTEDSRETRELLKDESEGELEEESLVLSTPPSKNRRWGIYATVLIVLVGAVAVFGLSKPSMLTGNTQSLEVLDEKVEGAKGAKGDEGTKADKIVDVLFDDTTIPAKGTTFCVYHALPSDEQYQAIDFTFTESKQNPGIIMMFTISDHAVSNLKDAGYHIKDEGSSVLDCSDMQPLMISQWSGGYLLMQQAPNANYHPEPIPKTWGMSVGKGTSRKHVLVRWEYRESSSGEDVKDEGTGFHIHLLKGNPRPVNFGEAKFAISQALPADSTITIPKGEEAYTLISQCTTQGTKDVFKGSGVEILTGHAFGGGEKGWLTGFRIMESKGGGKFKQDKEDVEKWESCRFPHYANQYLEDGDFKEIWKSDTVGAFIEPPHKVHIKKGNSYRLECIYNTKAATEDVTGGTGPDNANCQFQFYYREIPGDNEPFPGFCMDVGQWYTRAPAVPKDEAEKKFKKWTKNPKYQGPYKMMGNKCPNDMAKLDADYSGSFSVSISTCAFAIILLSFIS